MAGEVYIFAGGGTGGHVYPGLAVAEELRNRRPGATVVFACSNRDIDRQILEPLPFAFHPQAVRPLPARLLGWPGFLRAWWRAARFARALMADLQPVAVLGLGGFATGPVVCTSSRCGIPTALLNPDAIPGKANRHLAAKASVVFTQFPSTVKTFPAKLRERVRCVGCPVRRELIGASRDQAVAYFDLSPDRRTLLVFGGSLLAESLGGAIERLATPLADFASTWQVLHISASSRAEQIAQVLSGRGLTVRTLSYCDRMDLAYAAADLVMARAGAATVAELAATGTPAVLMPYPHHADRHQHLNAAELAAVGAAAVCDDRLDARANAVALRNVLLPLLRDPNALGVMSAAAKALAERPSAAAAVADWLAEVGRQQPVAGKTPSAASDR